MTWIHDRDVLSLIGSARRFRDGSAPTRVRELLEGLGVEVRPDPERPLPVLVDHEKRIERALFYIDAQLEALNPALRSEPPTTQLLEDVRVLLKGSRP